MYDWLCLWCEWSLFLVVYDSVGRISRLKWLYGWGIGYWDGVIVVVELWVFGFVCRCSGG